MTSTVYEFYASISGLEPDEMFTLEQHQGAVFDQRLGESVYAAGRRTFNNDESGLLEFVAPYVGNVQTSDLVEIVDDALDTILPKNLEEQGRNLFKNPSFEAAVVAAGYEIHRNRFKQPIPATASMFAPSRATVDFIDDPTGNYARLTVSETGAVYLNLANAATRIPVVAGEQAQYKMQVRLGAGALGMVLRMYAFDAGGTLIGAVGNDSPVNTSADWADVEITRTMPANAASAGVYVLMSGAPPIGATMDVRRVYGGAVHSPYFDGSFSPDPDLTPSWVGAPNASESILSGQRIELATGANCDAIMSRRWSKSGGYSMRLTGLKGSAGASRGIVGGTLVLKPSTTYTLLGTRWLPEPLTGTLGSYAGRVLVQLHGSGNIGSPILDNVAGEQALRWTFITNEDTTTASIGFGYGASVDSGQDVWWDDVFLIEGEYDGQYFDGDSPLVHPNVYSWAAVPRNSESIWFTGEYTP